MPTEKVTFTRNNEYAALLQTKRHICYKNGIKYIVNCEKC